MAAGFVSAGAGRFGNCAVYVSGALEATGWGTGDEPGGRIQAAVLAIHGGGNMLCRRPDELRTGVLSPRKQRCVESADDPRVPGRGDGHRSGGKPGLGEDV